MATRTITTDEGTVTITDNDGLPTVVIEDVVVDEAAGTVTVPVTLSNPSDVDTVIEIVTTSGTAGTEDYTETIVTVIIPAGETTGEVVIPITEDTIDEADETFTVVGTVTSGNTDNPTDEGTVTITDNDGLPTVVIEDVVVDEAAGTVTVPVTLSNPSDVDTVIEIVTTSGTAGTEDYTETIVTVIIPAGETTGEVVIPITEDTIDEADETFTVVGTVTSGNTDNPTDEGTVTITDNDGLPTVVIEDVVVDEAAGTVTVPVTLSNPSDVDTVIEIVTTSGTAGTEDYTETIVTVIIPAGETTGEVVIPITEDTIDEADETFTVVGTVTSGNTDNPTDEGTVTITDNDGAPTVVIEDVVVDEAAGTVTVPVTLSNPSDVDTVIEIVTTSGTAGTEDYTETIVTVIIPAGETTGEVVIPITEDTIDEADETFTVVGTVTSGNTDNTTDEGTVTITDNDGLPTVVIEDVVVDEAAGTVTVPVTLSNPSDVDTVIEIVTTSGTAGTEDYTETIVTVIIPAGETTGEVVIPITEDTIDEADETFTVVGTVTSGNTDNPTDEGTVTITDNDGAPTVVIEDVVVDEAAGTVTVPVTLSNPSDVDTVIEIVTTSGTAGTEDYTETIVTVIIPAGETTGEVVIPITEDTIDEADETFTVVGTVTSGNTDNPTDEGTVTITDNDGAPTVVIEDVVVDEAAGTVTVPVTLSNPSDVDTVIEIVTTSGTAGTEDYTETIVTVIIPAGETTGEVVIPITEDTIDEADETFTVVGTVTSGNTDNPTDEGTVTITDNDGAPTVVLPVAVDDDSLGNAAGSTVSVDVLADNGNGIDTDADGTLDPESVSLVIPSGATMVITDANGDVIGFTVPGEGVWGVNPLGEVSFAPENGFTADPTPVNYTIDDNDGNQSNEATVTIDYVPVALDDESLDNMTGLPVTVSVLDNDTLGDTVNPTTVMIIDPATGDPVTTLVVIGEGEWTVTETGADCIYTRGRLYIRSNTYYVYRRGRRRKYIKPSRGNSDVLI